METPRNLHLYPSLVFWGHTRVYKPAPGQDRVCTAKETSRKRCKQRPYRTKEVPVSLGEINEQIGQKQVLETEGMKTSQFQSIR